MLDGGYRAVLSELTVSGCIFTNGESPAAEENAVGREGVEGGRPGLPFGRCQRPDAAVLSCSGAPQSAGVLGALTNAGPWVLEPQVWQR